MTENDDQIWDGQCQAVIEARDGVHNLRGGNNHGIGRFIEKRCGRKVKAGEKLCYLHRKGGPYDKSKEAHTTKIGWSRPRKF